MTQEPLRRSYDGVGIDFGTTNSVIAVSSRGNPTPLTRPLVNPDDGLPYPSVVWYKLNEATRVGREAKNNLSGFSEASGNQFITSVKGALGRDKAFSIFGRKVGASDVASEIFEFLMMDAEQHHHLMIDKAIVTIPIHFDGRARRELRKAADRAGLYIKTFVHEPFAAIVGHLYGQRGFRALEQREGESILVFDWGGGTLDITVGRVEGGSLVELATAGLAERSGDHFDDTVMGYVKTAFANHGGISPERMVLLPSTKDRLRAECERCKINLSEVSEHRVLLADFLRHEQKSIRLDEPMTRATFEDLIQKDVDEAIQLVDSVLERSKLSDTDIDLVLLIGGTSRIPMVRGKMYDRFGTKVVLVENPDTIIAEGAAVVDALGLYPALARPLCIELSDGTNYEIFKAGDVAKKEVCRKDVALFCTDNRDGNARLVIKEGLDRQGVRFQTKTVLSIPVSSKLPRPYNHERVVASFALDDDLVLKVEAAGAIHPEGDQAEIFDLCFALKSYEGDT